MNEKDKDFFKTKLRSLTTSRSGIEVLSSWMIIHWEHYDQVVQMWFDELRLAKETKVLPFAYVANDVIQNSKSLGSDYVDAFGVVLKEALEVLATDAKVTTRNKIFLLLRDWKARRYYEPGLIKNFEELYCKALKRLHGIVEERDEDMVINRTRTFHSEQPYEPEDEETRSNDNEFDNIDFRRLQHSEILSILKGSDGLDHRSKHGTGFESEIIELKLNPGSTLKRTLGQEEMIRAVKGLETLPSGEVLTRSLIAEFPLEFSDVNLAKTACRDLKSALRLSVDITNSYVVLSDYSRRLDLENDIRIDATYKLQMFAMLEKEKLKLAEQLLHAQKQTEAELIGKLNSLEQFLKHLPMEHDSLPNVVDGLNPLPSAQDLFHF